MTLRGFLDKYQPLRSPDDGGSAGTGAGAPSSSPSSAGGGGTAGGDTSTGSSSSAASAAEGTSSDSGSPPAAPQGVESNDFTGLGEAEFDGFEDLGEVQIDEGAAPPQSAAQPQQVAQQQPAQVEQTQQQQPQAPQAQQPQATTESQAAVPLSQAEPQSLVEQMAQHESELIASLAADRFKLTKEEADALEVNAVEAIPRIMARTYMAATQSALLHIQKHVPRMIQNVVRMLDEQKKAEDSFYGRFKAIDRAKHAADVLNFSRAFRAANPQITQEDLFSMVGSAVMAKHGLVNQPAAPAAPQQPQVPAFVPARSGASVQMVPEPENPFAGLGRDHDE